MMYPTLYLNINFHDESVCEFALFVKFAKFVDRENFAISVLVLSDSINITIITMVKLLLR